MEEPATGIVAPEPVQHLIRLIESLSDVFDHLSLRHAFGGAIANNYWGIVRTTQDVDCLVLIPGVQYQQVVDELAAQGLVLRDQAGREHPLTVAAMQEQERERKLVEIFQRGIRAELFVPFIPLQDEILRRAVPMPFGSRTIPVTTAEDLILLKMTFHREKDLIDVRGILWVQRGHLDLQYLRSWSQRMLQDNTRRELEQSIGLYHERE